VERCRLGLHDECLPLLWYRDGDPVVLTCREVAEMANDYVDHDLPWLPRLQLQVHLALCRHCRTFTQQLVQAIQLLHHIREQSPGPEIEQRLLAAFEEAKDQAPRSRHGTRE
jgi:predicted anti-sigma-YlaC factor YlaD